jgi:hypothetical protein
MVIAFIFMSYNYEKKQKKTFSTILIGFMLFLIGAISLKFVNNDILNLVVFFAINMLFFILCFDVKLKEAIIFSIMLDAVMFCSEMITIYCASYIMKIPTDSYKTNYIIFVILTIISKIIYFAISQLLAFLINKLKFKSNKSTRFIPLFIFPILSIAMSFLFLRITFINNYNNDSYNIGFLVISILMIISSLYIFIYYQFLAKNDDKLNELQAENRLHEINNNYLEILQHQNDEMHMMFHDTKNHFLTISNMDTKEEIDKYISNVIGDIQKYDVIQHTNNKILDLLLSKYAVLCKNNNIAFNIEVRTANLNYISDSDLSIIINNLMDNALEATKLSSERVIDFSLRCVNDFDVLDISNSCDNEPLHYGRRLVTTKTSKELHGFGTKIIKKYANKNGATYEWFYDKDRHRFNSTIIFSK